MARWAVLAILIVFAGCAGPPAAAPAASAEPKIAGPAELDEDTGAVEGTVYDDSLQPVPGAEIALADRPSVLSDAQGRFAFSFVPPGEHALYAQRLGFEPVARRVMVVAGQVTRVDLEVVPLPLDEGTHLTVSKAGHVMCSVVWRPRVVTSGFSGGCPSLGEETIITEVPLAGPVPDIQTMVGETSWRSNQALGAGLMMGWSLGTDKCGASFGLVQGRAPLRIEVHSAFWLEVHANVTGGCAGVDPCATYRDCTVQTIGFSSPDTLGPSYAVDVGLTFDQRFTTYVTQFLRAPAPQNFTALPDV